MIAPSQLQHVIFHGISQMFSTLGGIHSSLTIVVIVLLSQYNLISYEGKIAKLCIKQNPHMFKEESPTELQNEIRNVLTPMNMFYMHH